MDLTPRALKRGLLFGIALVAMPGAAVGQSADWSSSLLIPAFPSPFFAEWERNPSNATLTLIYTGSRTVDYRIEGELRSATRGLVARAESPLRTVMPGPTTEVVTAAALDEWRGLLSDRPLLDEILRTGVIPEGEYEACARAVTPQQIQLTEACARFTIALPDAPELIYPSPDQTVSVDQPTFQWTPVALPPSLGTAYRLRVVERLPQQTPQTALAANVPHLDLELGATPLFVYPADGLPLEAGKEYVWQVEALDGLGQPLGPSGLKSQIWTFRKARSAVTGTGEPGTVPDIVTVVPALARLTGVSSVEADPTPTGFIMNGTVWLELASPYLVRVRVQLQDLVLDTTTGEPRIIGGRLVGRLQGSELSTGTRWVVLDRIVYDIQDGLRARGALAVGTETRLEGAAYISGAGLYGTLEAEDPAGLLTAGSGPVSLMVSRLSMALPDGVLSLQGEVGVFGQPTGCRTGYTASTDGQWTGATFCTPGLELPLVDGSDRAGLTVRTLEGSVVLSLADRSLTGDLSADARLVVDAEGTCSALLGLDIGTDVAVGEVIPDCPATGTPIRLGWLELRPSNLRVERLAYSTDSGFDFDLRLDVEPVVPASPGLPLPLVEGVAITPDGLTFPAVDLDVSGRTRVAGLGLRVNRASVGGARLSWTEYDRGVAGGLGFELDAEVTLPGLPSTGPGCLVARPLPVVSTALRDGRLTATLDSTVAYDPDTCRLDIGLATLAVEGVAGDVVVGLTDQPTLETPPALSGRLYPGEPLVCGTDPAWVPLAGVGLQPDGELIGAFPDVCFDCALQVGGAEVLVTTGLLELGDGAAVLTAAAEATFAAGGEPVTGQGELELELARGEVTGGAVDFAGPLTLDLALPDPLLSFRVDAARMDPAGLHFDGAAQLVLPDGAEVGSTFDDLTFGYGGGIAAGSVTFDAAFGLEAEIADLAEIDWRVVAADAPAPETGARLAVPEGASIGPGGLAIWGSGGVALRYEGRDLVDLDAEFSQDLLMGLTPASIEEGRIDVSAQGALVAYFDQAGFHPSLAYLGQEVIPDRLPLPNENVAYLQLRDTTTGTLNVAVDTAGQGVRLYTPADRTVPFVLPAVQQDGPPPSLDVTFDIRLDDFGNEVVSGEVVAGVPATATDFDLGPLGVPLTLDTLAYRDTGNGYVLEAIGRPVLARGLDPVDATVRVEIDPMGRLAGSFDVQSPGTVTLFGTASAGLAAHYEGVRGSIDADLNTGSTVWSVELPGELRMTFGTGDPYAVGARLVATPTGITLEDLGAAGDVSRTFGFGDVALEISDLSVPYVEYVTDQGWDFEIWVDLAIVFPELGGFTLPAVEDVAVGPDGVALPAVQIPSLPATTVEAAGFRITPLAFRMDPLQLDLFGGAPPTDWGFAFDLELALGDLPATASQELRDLRLTVLDASYAVGAFAGTVETRVPAAAIPVPAGGYGSAFSLTELRGSLTAGPDGQEVALEVDARWTPPDFLSCQALPADGVELTADATLALDGAGSLSGTVQGVATPCPFVLDPFRLELTGADLTLAAGPEGQEARLDVDATLYLPSPAGDSASATGALVLDALEPRVVSGFVEITDPFLWDVPRAAPFLEFTVSQGRLDAQGLTLGGSGSLLLGGNESVTVTFDALRFALPSLELVDGSATIESAFALDGSIRHGALDWTAAATTAPAPSDPALRLVLPSPVTVDPQGVTIAGTGSARIAFADSVFTGLAASFENGFRIAFDPVTVTDGRAGLILDQTEIAYVDEYGFHPGDIFGVVPVPARLGLPTEDIAYLQLRDPTTDALLIESAAATEGYRLNTRPNETVALVLPALAGPNGDPPTVNVSFDIVVDDVTLAVVSGGIEASVPATSETGLFGLAGLDLPLQVRRVAYDSDVPAMTVDARLELPASMDLAVDFTALTLTADGLTGTAELGSYRQGAPADATVVTADLGVLELEVQGARAELGADPSFELGGAIRMDLFAASGQLPEPLPFTATVTTAGVELTTDPSQLTDGRLPLGIATFEPVSPDLSDPIDVTVTESELTLELSGVLRVPSLASGFALTVEGLKVGTGGVAVDGVTLAGTGEQTLGLFGLELTLRDVDGQPAFDVSYAAGVLRLAMSGELDFFGHGAEFAGLEVGTDGSFGMARAELLVDSVDIVPETVTLTGLGIANDSLAADFLVELPAPLDGGGPQEATLRIASDGGVSGGGQIALIEETQGLGDGRTQFGTPVATAHLRYLGLQLSTTDLGSNAVQVVSDIYIANEASNVIELGSTGLDAVTPGLEIGFDGQVTWGQPTFGSLEFAFLDVLLLDVTDIIPITSGDVMTLRFDGGFGLDLNAVSGSVQFDDFRVSSNLEFDASNLSVVGGDLTISGLIAVELREFAFSPSDTTITIEGGSMPDQDGTSGLASAETEQLAVRSFVRFGGSLSLGSDCGNGGTGCLFSGGVREFLFYRTQDDNRVGFVADSVTLKIPDVFELEAEMEFEERTDGFQLQVGGIAMVQGKTFRTVGAIDNSGPELRAGIFLAVSQQIPIIPPILMLTEVGGGFFYNPTPEHIDLVHKYADVPNLARDSVSASAAVGKFTGLIYARAAVGADAVGDARVLLTASEQGVQLDGLMAVLQTGGDRTSAPIRGSIHLLMGFDPVFAEGDFALTLDYSPVLTGSQGLAFYVYDNAWGVWGGGSMTLFELLDGSSEFIIGPRGFYTQGALQADIDFWIIKAYGEAESSIWYLNDPRDWGAYMRLAVGVDLFSGAITADASMHAALVSDRPNLPYAYGGAEARGCFLGKCARLNVHMKIVDGKVSGGLGRDWALEQEILERARQVAAEMEQSAADMIAAVESSRPTAQSLALSDAELAAAYQRLQTLPVGEADQIFDDARRDERAFRPLYNETSEEANHYYWYEQLATQVTIPQLSASSNGPQTLEELEDTVIARLDRLQALEPDVRDRIAAIELQIDELRDVADEPWPTSPVRTVSTAAPSTAVEGGRKVLLSGPTFDVDAQEAADAQQSMRDREAAAAQRRREAWERLGQVTAGLASVRTATSSMGETSPMNFAGLHAQVTTAAEEQWARHADLILRRQDWLREGLTDLTGRYNNIMTILTDKSEEIRQNQPSPLYEDPNELDTLEDLARARATHLDALAGTDTILSSFEAEVAKDPSLNWFQSQANTYGLQFWYDVARAGMEAADSMATLEFQEVKSGAAQALGTIRAAHRSLTGDLDDMFQKQVELTGSAYDLYDRFQLWFDTAGTGTAMATAFDPTIFDQDVETLDESTILSQLAAGKAELAVALQTPSMTKTEVTVVREGYLSREQFFWYGTHPSGDPPYEYLFDQKPGDFGFVGTWQMMTDGGLGGAYEHFAFAPSRNAPDETHTFRAAVRNGAGYIGLGRAIYERRFVGGPGATEKVVDDYTAQPDTTAPGRPWIKVHPATTADTVWLGDRTRMGRVTYGAFDWESGIDEYAYAIGAAPLGGEVSARRNLHRGWTSTGGRTEATITRTSLSMDSVYKVMVRAWNADRLSSNPGFSKPFRVDTTPPVFYGDLQTPQALTTTTTTTLDSDGGFETTTYSFDASLDTSFETEEIDLSTLEPSTDSLNSWASPACPGGLTGVYLPPAYGAVDTPFVTLLAPTAGDDESGVDRYWWRADTDTTRLVTPDGWTALPDGQVQFDAKGDPMTFRDSFYVSMVATNRAGLPSEPVVYGPFVPADTSAPAAAVHCISQATPDRFALHFSDGGADLETGISERSYRIRAADGTVVLDWTEPVAWQLDAPDRGDVFMAAAAPLQSGTDYYVDVRLRNGQDGRSYASSGPLRVDHTPPPAPSVTVLDADAGADAALIHVGLNIPDDPETGVAAIRWVILDPGGAFQFDGELELEDLSGDVATTSLTGGSLLAGSWEAFIALSRSSLGLGPDDPFLEPQNEYRILVYTVNGVDMPSPEDSSLFWTR